ncbi:metal ABC transporter solute-binding protein, Zn/Mn family [Globicatella sanguinis]
MKRMITFLGSILLLLSTMLPSTLVNAAENKLTIVTSFYPIYAITSEVVGDLHEVKMINSGTGIHGFEPSASDVAAIYDADIFIYHSKSLESWTKNLEANKGSHPVQMIQASEGLEFRTVDGSVDDGHDHDHGEESDLNGNTYDLHSWLDPIEVGNEAKLIAQSLAKIDPDNADIYTQNAEKMVKKGEALVEQYQAMFNELDNKTFLTQHTAFYYLAERFGLKQLGVTGISAEKEPSAKQLNEVMAFVKEHNIKTIFVEPNMSDKIAQIIAASTGVEIAVLNPLESDPQNGFSFLENYEEQLKTLVEHLK